ncbi:hypothetical protein AB0M44_49250 [Streptosporangium subroseum]|uniref:hypothetical protein n=1 Tax=Streptosporangium subroseum TaxID=106412 RepID=UPI00343B5121
MDPVTLTAENRASMIDHDKPPIDVTALNTSWCWAAGGIVSTEGLTHCRRRAGGRGRAP